MYLIFDLKRALELRDKPNIGNNFVSKPLLKSKNPKKVLLIRRSMVDLSLLLRLKDRYLSAVTNFP